jgi:plastocyanin
VSTDRCLATLAIMFLAVPAGSLEQAEPSYLPTQSAAEVLSVAKEADATAGVVVLTEALAIKEMGPKETVARFGETYAFSPAVFAVYRDEPTLITFRNLQPDDAHDFMLTDPHGTVLMKVDLPSLKDTSYVFTFHRDGIFPFYCTMHQPAMSGQIIVLPPKSGG